MPGMFDDYKYQRMRSALPANDPMHAVLGPLEHRDFVREFTRDGGPLAGLSMAAAIPVYTALKAAGLLKARSPASWDEIFAGYEGLFSGLRDRRKPPQQERPQYASSANN